VKPRRPSLGERIAAVEHIRCGRTGIAETAEHFGVEAREVERWMRAHADERTLLLGEIRDEIAGEPGRLLQQAQRLRRLIARADRTLRFLHAQLLSRKLASPPRQIPHPSP
jgi:transposase-like protein